MRYSLVLEAINGQQTAWCEHSQKEYDNDVTAMKESRTVAKLELLKMYESVKCSVHRIENEGQIKIFEFEESRNSHKRNVFKFLNRVDFS
jgi:hypothetical protein